jgi:hypothetical protein
VFYLSRLVESRRWSSPDLLRAVSELVEPNGEVTVRERALRANDELLEPLAKSLLSSYLLQVVVRDTKDEEGSKAHEHVAQTGEQARQEHQAIRRRVS